MHLTKTNILTKLNIYHFNYELKLTTSPDSDQSTSFPKSQHRIGCTSENDTMNNINLPEHWKVARLGDVCNIVMGQSPPSTTYNGEGIGMPFLQGKAEFTELFPMPTKYCTKQLRISPEGSVLMSVRAPVGDVNLADRKYIIGRGLTSISLKNGNNRFLFYCLLHNKKEFQAKSSGSTFKSINKTTINDFRIPLPPLPEQRAIAHVLQTIQETKFTRQREIELERERKAALMDVLFSHGTKGESRKQTEIGEIPENWEVVRLGNYCYKPDYGYTESANESPVGPKFLRITDIQNDAVNWENVPYCICDEDVKEKYLLKTGDIVIARIGATTGKAYIIDDCPEAIFASYLIRVRTKDNLLPAFLAQYFRTNNYWRQIEQSKGGRLKGGVNIPILTNLVIPFPPSSEQQQIAAILQACDTKITALEQEAQHLDELFHAMLDELMTGQRSAVPLIDTEMDV